MNTMPYLVTMGALLMLSLFMADSWVLGNAPDSENPGLYAVLLAIFVLFAAELICMCFVFEGYIFSLFFWLDLLGTFSIVIDIAWISDSFIPSSTLASQGSVVRTTRAARLASRYGRLLRLMRIMRVLKTLPCFKLFSGDDRYFNLNFNLFLTCFTLKLLKFRAYDGGDKKGV